MGSGGVQFWFYWAVHPNPLPSARQAVQARCYWGITGRVRTAIYGMSHWKSKHGEIVVEWKHSWGQQIFLRVKKKKKSCHVWLLFPFFPAPLAVHFVCWNLAKACFPSFLTIKNRQVVRMSNKWGQGVGWSLYVTATCGGLALSCYRFLTCSYHILVCCCLFKHMSQING